MRAAVVTWQVMAAGRGRWSEAAWRWRLSQGLLPGKGEGERSHPRGLPGGDYDVRAGGILCSAEAPLDPKCRSGEGSRIRKSGVQKRGPSEPGEWRGAGTCRALKC